MREIAEDVFRDHWDINPTWSQNGYDILILSPFWATVGRFWARGGLWVLMQKKGPESIQDRPKIPPKSLKMEFSRGSGQCLGVSGLQEASQILPRRHLNVSWEPLGRISGRFYRVLGASLGSLEPDFRSKRKLN